MENRDFYVMFSIVLFGDFKSRLPPLALLSRVGAVAAANEVKTKTSAKMGRNGEEYVFLLAIVIREKRSTALDLVSLRRGAVWEFKMKICYGTRADKGTRTRKFTVSDTEFDTNYYQTYCCFITVNNSISPVVPLLLTSSPYFGVRNRFSASDTAKKPS